MVCTGIVVSCSCKDVVSQNHTFDLCRQLVFWIYSLRALIRNQLSWRINANVCIDHGTFLINTFFIDKTAFAGPVTSTNISASCYVFSPQKIQATSLKKICTLRNENMTNEKMNHWWLNKQYNHAVNHTPVRMPCFVRLVRCHERKIYTVVGRLSSRWFTLHWSWTHLT